MAELSKREARKQNIRNSILHNSYQLFVEKGYDNTTVDDILTAAGVSRRTFFKYFPMKSDLLHHFSQEMVRLTRNKTLALSDNRWSVKRRLNEYFKYSAQKVIPANDFARTLLRDALSSVPRTNSQGNPEQLGSMQDAIIELLRDGFDKGELDNSIPLDVQAEVVTGIYNAVIINWINNPDYPLESRLKQAAKVAYKAIAATDN